MIKSGTITATKLRLILGILLLLTGILATLFVLAAQRELSKYAADVSQVTVDSIASQSNIQTLQKIQQELLANKDAIQRTNEIVADSQSYQYQDQIITDLNDYAKRAGISVTNIDFLAADPGVATTTPAPGAAAAPVGVKSTSVSVTLKNPVNYENLLRFIKSIEQNLTKMQISRIGLTKDAGDGITSGALNIEVYIR